MASHLEEDVTEDLVLKNSPLDQYLKEIGISDFTSYSSPDDNGILQKTPCSEVMSSALSATKLGQPPTSKPLINWSLRNIKATFVFFINQFLLPNSFTNFRKSMETILALFSSSELLSNVEKQFKCTPGVIYGNSASSQSGRSSSQAGRSCKPCSIESSFTRKIFGSTSIHILIICISVSVLLGSVSLSMVFGAAVLIVVVMLLIFTVAYQYIVQRERTKFSSTTIQLTKVFISNIETICRTFDKSFLLVRECEIISQGYTFYHPALPTVSFGSRKRGSCVMLREAIMENTLELFETIASIAKHLMSSLPKGLHLIYDKDGIFNINLDELKSSVSKIGLTENGMPQTDLLKSMIFLIRSELIELFQIIVLLVETHLGRMEACSDNFSDLKNLLYTFCEIYNNNNATIGHILDDMGSKFSFTKDNEFKENLSGTRTKLSLPSSPLQMKIDSAFLHLKSAIGHLEGLESMVPHILESDWCSGNDKELPEKVNNFVNVFNHEITSAKECVNDINTSLSSKMGQTSEDKYPVLSKFEVPEQDLDVRLFDCHSLPQQEGDLLLEGISEPLQYQDEFVKAEQLPLDKRILDEHLTENKRLVKELKAIFSFKKSPVGLVPLDLVKENMNAGRIVEESEHDVVTKPSVYMNEIGARSSFDATSQFETENSLELRGPSHQNPMGCESESIISRSVVPPYSMLNDLKCALLHRQQQGLLNESMIEADACAFDSDDNSEAKSYDHTFS